jgi:hypothetical protein
MPVSLLPSADEIVAEVVRKFRDLDVNGIHAKTYDSLLRHRNIYYARRVDELLAKLEIDDTSRRVVRNALLSPLRIGDVQYSNFMEEVARRMSQSMQPISGRIAEVCAEIELKRAGLNRDVDYGIREKRTDITIYHPRKERGARTHRVEVKNMKLRERAARGLVFDAESLFGFFDDPGEFTSGNLTVLEKTCIATGGYVYVPPATLEVVRQGHLVPVDSRLRPNTRFAHDMAEFAHEGKISPT